MYLTGVHKGTADTAQDEYLFNYSGVSGKFYYDQNKSDFMFSDYKPIKIFSIDNGDGEYNGYNFKAILENGLKLDFDEYETMDGYGNSTTAPHYKKFKTSSYLTKVTSANQIDYVTFDYDTYTYNKGKTITGDYVPVCGQLTNVNNWTSPEAIPNVSSAYVVTEKNLKRINFKNGYVLFQYSFGREDSDSPKLDHIEIYSKNNGVESLIKKIKLNYSYYNRLGGKTYSSYLSNPNQNNKSLKLLEVEIFSNNNTPETYKFEYNQTQLPTRNSSGQDFWGYANNNSNSFVHKRTANLYYPSVTSPKFNSTYTLTAEIGSGDRSADEDKTQAGILTRIYYPTGGYTDFEYEANKYTTIEKVPTYKSFGGSLYSQGKGGEGITYCSATGKKTKSLTTTNDPIDARINISFSNALGGDGGYESYVSFNGKRYVRSFTNTLPYPSTSYNEKITLNKNTTYILEAFEKGIGTSGAAGCPFVTVQVSWKEFTGYTNKVVEHLVGGIRIKSITNYDGINSSFATKKTFEYSSPTILSPIVDQDYQTINWPDCLNTFSSHPSYALNVNGGPSVEYKKVTEYNHDHQNNDLGKTVYEYELTPADRIMSTTAGSGSVFNIFRHPNYYPCTLDGLTIKNELPYIRLLRTLSYGNFANYYVKSWASGNLKSQTHYKRHSDGRYIRVKTIESKYQSVDESRMPVNYIKATFGSQTPQVSPSSFTNRCGYQTANNSFIYNTGFISFGKKLLTSTKETTYDTNGENPVVTEKSYTYNHPNYFLTESTAKDSKKGVFKTKTYYPNARNGLTGLSTTDKNMYGVLEQQHRIATPIQTESYRDNALLSTQRTLYKQEGNSARVKSIQTAKGAITATNILEDRVHYHRYNTSGKPVEVSRADGTRIVYIWGYQEELPIAKIENATYSEVSGYISDLQNKSNADTDHCNTSSCKEQILRNALQTLREALPNAMVSTYTYDPLVGVTSMTDPKGYTMYYTYDGFNRLEFVKDADGNLISENKYHYKNN
ncbi:hypothetical protein ABW636_07635 [Aquimarina sp. 2201CG1-2-11]|uniref:hypothetical protein n=1 Tax=Aquimarina discodermiae TaxID=3231043 RepID=UPI0034626D63